VSLTQNMFGRTLAIGAVTAAGTALLLGTTAGVAGAATEGSGARVLPYYLQNQSHEYLTPAGKPFTPSASHPIKPGDQIERTDLLFAGTSASHAATWSATDHQLCVFNAQGDAVCQAQIAVDGSLILTEVTQSRPKTTIREKVVGGAGAYAGVTGKAVIVLPTPLALDGDLTITLHGVVG
jgi:hypothetical protein